MTSRALGWRKAPLALRHFPGVLAGVVSATAVLGLAGASAPLFFASAGASAVAARVDDVGPWQAGLMVRAPGPLGDRALFDARTRALRRASSSETHLGDPVATVVGGPVSIGTGARAAQAVIVGRDGFTEHIEVLARARDGFVAAGPAARPFRACDGPAVVATAPAVWVPASVAGPASLCPGDELELARADTTVAVAGAYTDLRVAPRRDYWELLAPLYEGEEGLVFLATDPETALEVGRSIGGTAEFRWEVPVRRDGLTLEAAVDVERTLRDAIADVRSGSGALGELFASGVAESLLLDIERVSERMVSRSRGPVTLLALGGTLLALAVTAAAGAYAVHRRRVEFALLWTRGMSPWALAGRAAVECAVPALVGGALGWAVCVGLVRAVGPSPLVDTGAMAAGALWAAAAVLGGVVLLAIVTAVRAGGGDTARAPTARRVLRAVPWDLGALGLAYLSWRRLSVPRDATGPVEVDVFVLLFPVLFVAGATGVVMRLLGLVLPRLRRVGGHLRPATFLALRRLGAATGGALALVAIAAVAVGAFLYANTLARSSEVTTRAKALTFIGSDVAVRLPAEPAIPETVDAPATLVLEVYGARLMPDLEGVDVLGIDPSTFTQAAFWDESFSARPLAELARLLDWRPSDGEPVPAVAVGTALAPGDELVHGGVTTEVRQVGAARAWPGPMSNRPMIVVDKQVVLSEQAPGATLVGTGARHELWAKGPEREVLDALSDGGVSVEDALTLSKVGGARSLVPLGWALGFLQALGVAAATLALVGMVLYLQARQRARVVADALAARMGLSRAARAAAVAIELVAMLAASFLLGATLSRVAAGLVHVYLDPLPSVPPPPLLRVPAGALVAIAAALALATLIGVWRVQRAGERANIAEVLRVGG